MGSPIRILHVVVNMNRGGAETFIMNLYRHIDRTKVQFDFLTCKEGVFDEEIMALGGKIHRIPYLTEAGHKGYISALNRFFQENSSYQIVHSHMDKISGFVLRAARLARIPVRIAHSHNTRSEGSIAARLYKWYSGTKVKSAATTYVACSQAAARWLFGGKAKSASIFQNGIPCEKFAFSSAVRSELRAELAISEESLVVGHIGRYAPQKNHFGLIDLFKQLQLTREDSVLLLVGDGPLRPAIEQKVKELQLTDKVKFLGIRSDIERLLQAFDVFLFPSHHEGLPVTLIEAQGSGLPCVISDHITSEVDMGIGLIQFFSLTDGASCVSKILESAKQQSRRIPFDALAKKGYDIQITAQSAVEFYFSQIEVNHENINRVYAHV